MPLGKGVEILSYLLGKGGITFYFLQLYGV